MIPINTDKGEAAAEAHVKKTVRELSEIRNQLEIQQVISQG